MTDASNIVVPAPVSSLSVDTGCDAVTIVGQGSLIEIVAATAFEVAGSPTAIEVCGPGPRGAAGPQGPAGEAEGATFQAVAGETIHGRRVVRIVDGLIYRPDIFEPSHASQVVGLVLGAGVAGSTLTVRTAGEHSEGTWNFSPGMIWCGADGVLTQSPVPGWVLPVGRAKNPTTIIVDVDQPTLRS